MSKVEQLLSYNNNSLNKIIVNSLNIVNLKCSTNWYFIAPVQLIILVLNIELQLNFNACQKAVYYLFIDLCL